MFFSHFQAVFSGLSLLCTGTQVTAVVDALDALAEALPQSAAPPVLPPALAMGPALPAAPFPHFGLLRHRLRGPATPKRATTGEVGGGRKANKPANKAEQNLNKIFTKKLCFRSSHLES